MTVVVPRPSVVSEVWLNSPLCGEFCFLISACSYLERSQCRVAAVASAPGAGVRLGPSALDGESATLVLL